MVWVNSFFLRDLRTPFGGAKMSGLGRQGGRYALEFWTEPKLVCVAYGAEPEKENRDGRDRRRDFHHPCAAPDDH